jgi:hypothetical protein
MAERSMRGTRLGAQSLESDAGVPPAARQLVRFTCPAGHDVVVPMSIEADLPPSWECRCGETALRENAAELESKPVKAPRTHWDMLLERRTRAELEDLLQERLLLLRSGALTSRAASMSTKRRSA